MSVKQEDILAAFKKMIKDQDTGNYDPEAQHSEADELLSSLLRSLRFDEIADLYDILKKEWWYA